jgi:plasmid stabilization system protein ParE
LAKSLSTYPERFAQEEYLKSKVGDYHSVTKWSYKIVYKITGEHAVILDILHTSMDPLSMGKIE